MPEMLDQLHADHVNIAHILALLDLQAGIIERGEHADLRLLSDIVFYISRYPDMYHHPREDLMFDVLRRREPGSAATVDELGREHKELKATALELLDALSAFPGSTVMPRGLLVGQLRGYVELCRRHMDVEEGTVFPLARQRLTDADWQALANGLPGEEDPLFGRAIAAPYRSLHDSIMREVRRSAGQAR
jgi:hemerythrin-like domain-containing protein